MSRLAAVALVVTLTACGGAEEPKPTEVLTSGRWYVEATEPSDDRALLPEWYEFSQDGTYELLMLGEVQRGRYEMSSDHSRLTLNGKKVYDIETIGSNEVVLEFDFFLRRAKVYLARAPSTPPAGGRLGTGSVLDEETPEAALPRAPGASARSLLKDKLTDMYSDDDYDVGRVWYYAAEIDLDGDGTDEVVAHVVGPMMCGSAVAAPSCSLFATAGFVR